jgi:ankyrin repeat protein
MSNQAFFYDYFSQKSPKENKIFLNDTKNKYNYDKTKFYLPSSNCVYRYNTQRFINSDKIKRVDYDEINRNELHKASWYGDKETVELLIRNGIDINEKDIFGRNALHLASLNGKKEIVELLINRGIDLDHKDQEGRNALYLASWNGHKDIVELLESKLRDECFLDFTFSDDYKSKKIQINDDKEINSQIDLNEKDTNGRNALHLASWNGQKDVVELLLLKKQISLNEKDITGRNALHLAIEKGHKEIAELLISKGIDLNQKDNNDCNVLDLLYDQHKYEHQKDFDFFKNIELKELLIKCGLQMTDRSVKNTQYLSDLISFKSEEALLSKEEIIRNIYESFNGKFFNLNVIKDKKKYNHLVCLQKSNNENIKKYKIYSYYFV